MQSESMGTQPTYEEQLLGFVVALFRGEPSPLPLLGNAQIWRETLPRLEGIMARAALQALIHEGGWRKRACIVGERVRRRRLWEAEPFKALSLQFGSESIKVLVALFEARRTNKASNKNALRQRLEALDLAARPAEDLCMLRLTEGLLRQDETRPLGLVVIDVMSAPRLFYAAQVGGEEPSEPDALTRFFDAWGWTMPWLAESFARPLIAADGRKLHRKLQDFTRTLQHLTALFDATTTLALKRGRHDWLLLALVFFERAYGRVINVEQTLAPLQVLTRNARVAERQDVQDLWGGLLRVMKRLNAERQRALRVHPVDREPEEMLYLAAWQERDMDSVADAVEELRVSLERVLG